MDWYCSMYHVHHSCGISAENCWWIGTVQCIMYITRVVSVLRTAGGLVLFNVSCTMYHVHSCGISAENCWWIGTVQCIMYITRVVSVLRTAGGLVLFNVSCTSLVWYQC